VRLPISVPTLKKTQTDVQSGSIRKLNAGLRTRCPILNRSLKSKLTLVYPKAKKPASRIANANGMIEDAQCV
jgi:hypothetical protein